MDSGPIADGDMSAPSGGSTEQPTPEELIQKHKLEKKDLQAAIQKLKKNVNNCKKKKKEVADEITRLEKDLKERQELELKRCSAATHQDQVVPQMVDQVTELTLTNTDDEPNTGPKVSRAAKRRAKKAEVANQREAELKVEREYQFLNSPRAIETRRMFTLIRERGFAVNDIPADGDCLYAAVSHQLAHSRTSSQLRHVAADHMRGRSDEFMPFLTHPDTGNLLTEEQFQQYCDDVADTHTWGGQPELQALSDSLNRRIEVLQAEGSSIVLGAAFPGDTLMLAYYRHCFSLGEHYNSLVPLVPPS